MSNVNVFVSFDLDHDRDLCDLLLEQSANGRLGFEVSGQSAPYKLGDPEHARVRRQIREANQVIVICGEHTCASVGVFSELRIAQEEQTPYFLLWGRRDSMCTKPEGARPSEGMYGWTYQILQDQVTFTSRSADWEARSSARKPPGKVSETGLSPRGPEDAGVPRTR